MPRQLDEDSHSLRFLFSQHGWKMAMSHASLEKISCVDYVLKFTGRERHGRRALWRAVLTSLFIFQRSCGGSMRRPRRSSALQQPVSIPKAVQSADTCQATEREMGAAWSTCKIEKKRFAEKTESGTFDISWLLHFHAVGRKEKGIPQMVGQFGCQSWHANLKLRWH